MVLVLSLNFHWRISSWLSKSFTKETHLALLDNRTELSIAEYEAMFAETLDTDIDQTLEDELKYSISAINNTVRSYRN